MRILGTNSQTGMNRTQEQRFRQVINTVGQDNLAAFSVMPLPGLPHSGLHGTHRKFFRPRMSVISVRRNKYIRSQAPRSAAKHPQNKNKTIHVVLCEKTAARNRAA